MNKETIQIDSMEEVYDIMRTNLGAAHEKILNTIQDIGDEKKAIYEILDDILEFCNISYFTVDALIQIQLGIIKNTEHVYKRE